MVSENRYFRLISDRLTASAVSEISERNVVAAFKDCVKALKLDPKNFDAYLTASSCQLSQGNFEEAKSFLKQAQSQVPSNGQQEIEILTEQLKVICIEKTLADAEEGCSQGRYEEVLTDMDLLTKAVFCHELVWRLKVVALLETVEVSKIDTVIDEAQECLECIPSNSTRRCWWCWLLLQRRWWDIKEDIKLIIGAANKLISALEIESLTSLDIYPAPAGPIQKRMVWKVLSLEEATEANGKGKASLEQEKYQEAIDCFSKALEIIKLTGAPPQFWSEVCFRRSGVYLEQGSHLKAIRDACFAIAINPLHARSYLRLGQMYLDLDHPSGTRAIMNKMKDRCTLRTEYETTRMKSLLSNAKERKKQASSFNACKFMGLYPRCKAAQIKKTKNKLALMVHPDKVLSVISGKIDWMTEKQCSTAKERELKIQKELKEQMEHLFKQLTHAAQTLLDKRV